MPTTLLTPIPTTRYLPPSLPSLLSTFLTCLGHSPTIFTARRTSYLHALDRDVLIRCCFENTYYPQHFASAMAASLSLSRTLVTNSLNRSSNLYFPFAPYDPDPLPVPYFLARRRFLQSCYPHLFDFSCSP